MEARRRQARNARDPPRSRLARAAARAMSKRPSGAKTSAARRPQRSGRVSRRRKATSLPTSQPASFTLESMSRSGSSGVGRGGSRPETLSSRPSSSVNSSRSLTVLTRPVPAARSPRPAGIGGRRGARAALVARGPLRRRRARARRKMPASKRPLLRDRELARRSFATGPGIAPCAPMQNVMKAHFLLRIAARGRLNPAFAQSSMTIISPCV